MDLGPRRCFSRRGAFRSVIALATALVFWGSSGAAQAAEIARYRPLAPPPISADAVFVTDISSGTELFAQNADEPLPPASLTKIVSALVVLERANLEDIVEIQEADLVGTEESQAGLVAGDHLSARDLLPGMRIPPGHDA